MTTWAAALALVPAWICTDPPVPTAKTPSMEANMLMTFPDSDETKMDPLAELPSQMMAWGKFEIAADV